MAAGAALPMTRERNTPHAVAQAASLLVCLAWAAACGGGPQRIEDPIPDLPLNQQRSVMRSDFGWRWPFVIGVGTLGCASGAVVFRTGDVTYALNSPAMAKGFPSARPIQLTVHSGPRNPLVRIKQDERVRIFAQAAACSGAGGPPAHSGACRQRLQETHGVTDDELTQIEAEGNERRWPPLPAEYASVSTVVDAGLKLCPQ